MTETGPGSELILGWHCGAELIRQYLKPCAPESPVTERWGSPEPAPSGMPYQMVCLRKLIGLRVGFLVTFISKGIFKSFRFEMLILREE